MKQGENQEMKSKENPSVELPEEKEGIGELKKDDSELDINQYKEYLIDEDEEEPVTEPLFYKILMIVSSLFLLVTIGIIVWGYFDIQQERKTSLERMEIPKGESVKISPENKKTEKIQKNENISFKEAQKLMKEPMERFGQHVTKTDEMSSKFLTDPDVAYTTEWKMDYQSHMKEIRASNAELQEIIAKTEDNVLNDYGQVFNKIVDFTAMRYEAIVEKDQEKLIHALNIANEVEKDLPELSTWFK